MLLLNVDEELAWNCNSAPPNLVPQHHSQDDSWEAFTSHPAVSLPCLNQDLQAEPAQIQAAYISTPQSYKFLRNKLLSDHRLLWPDDQLLNRASRTTSATEPCYILFLLAYVSEPPQTCHCRSFCDGQRTVCFVLAIQVVIMHRYILPYEYLQQHAYNLGKQAVTACQLGILLLCLIDFSCSCNGCLPQC